MKSLKKVISLMLTAGMVTLSACASTNHSIRDSKPDRETELREEYGCVGVGYSPNTSNANLARTTARARARTNYMEKCLGKTEADLGLFTENPLQYETEIADDGRLKVITYKSK